MYIFKLVSLSVFKQRSLGYLFFNHIHSIYNFLWKVNLSDNHNPFHTKLTAKFYQKNFQSILKTDSKLSAFFHRFRLFLFSSKSIASNWIHNKRISSYLYFIYHLYFLSNIRHFYSSHDALHKQSSFFLTHFLSYPC